MSHPVPTPGTRERLAYDQLDDSAKRLVAEWHDNDLGTNLLQRIRQHPQRKLIHRALGY